MADEQKKQEAEAAAAQINEILSQSRPKNAVAGVGNGVSNIVAGAVGAVGVIILAPTIGAAAGTKSGGIVGGVVGLTGGAVVGVIGGAALAVGGAVSGVSQMVRGLVNTPEAMMAPRQGKWWNELEGRWIKTDLPADYKTTCMDFPEDDADLLGDVTKEVEASAALGVGESVDVMETYYYDILEVGPSAEPSAIKRRYYVLARKYHPDKLDKDDKEGADKFKDIAEAYQVLSDPDLRKKYNAEGRDGLSADKTSAASDMPKVDPSTLFAFLFGSDKFTNYIGRLATATSAMVGDSPKVSVATARIIQHRRVTRLAVTLAERLQKWTEEDYDFCIAMWQTESAELATASFGPQLVHLIGKVYNLAAIQFLGSSEAGIGMPSIGKWAANQRAKMDSKTDKNKNKMDTLRSGMTMMTMQAKFQEKLAQATTDEEKTAIQEEMESALSTTLLKLLWTTTTVDITNTLYETMQMVLFDQSVDKETRKRRAHGLKKLGEVFMACPEPEMGENEEEKDAKKLYEEAAFAAMLETIKKKEEAQQKASGN